MKIMENSVSGTAHAGPFFILPRDHYRNFFGDLICFCVIPINGQN